MATRLPPRLVRAPSRAVTTRCCPGHRAWVRRHHCSVPGCLDQSIECAHVRRGTGGGVGLKPHDRWCISLCANHHAEQHRLGEAQFEQKYGIDLAELARQFSRRSPHWRMLQAQVVR